MLRRLARVLIPILGGCLVGQVPTDLAPAAKVPPTLVLEPGDHVAILGNALADRMQHSGWFEAMLHSRFPGHRLVVRTLAVAGDEVTTWHRSDGFGSRDEWLAHVGADVVFAFYGYNESFAGDAGLPRFRDALDGFVRDLSGRTFGKRGPTRVVLFGPIANERHRDPAIPDPARNNGALRRYAAAMAEVASARDVPFVDLFGPSSERMAAAAAASTSLTVNGIHLDDEGDRRLATPMFQALFGAPPPPIDAALHAAVLAKNRSWHQRYRTIDAYNIHGGRSHERYAPKARDGTDSEPITNRAVLQEEMRLRDRLTEQADAALFAVAAGEPAPKVPAVVAAPPVPTNQPGDRDDLGFTYPDGEAVIRKLKIAPGCRVELFADEKRFPQLVNPVQMAFDGRGRLWVAAWPDYPQRPPVGGKGDALLVLTDDDHDGRADRCVPFLEDLNAPTGFTFWRDGVLVVQAPNLWFVRDTDGDGRGDWRQIVVMGIDSADSHHTTNAMGLDPAGNTTFSDGVFHRTQIETHDGPLRHADSAIWRYEPRSGRVELYAPYELVNPHGRAWDHWGNDLITNATGNHTFFGPAISGFLAKGKHAEMREFWQRPSRPCAGTAIVSSAHFPEDWQGDFLNLNVIGLQGITRVQVDQDGSGLRGTTVENLVVADPAEVPSFRPVAIVNGPDGALYFADWAQMLIGHLQHHIRDRNRDHDHGRIYRLTRSGRPLATPPRIVGATIPELVALLRSPVQDTRTLAKLELGCHPPSDVMAVLRPWWQQLDRNAIGDAHALLEALWSCQSLAVVDVPLLDAVLASPEPRARAAATKVLTDWRRQVPDLLPRLLLLAADADPRVRLMAVRGASFVRGDGAAAAAGVVFAALRQPTDYWLDYVVGETMRQLNSEAGVVLQPDDPADDAAYAKHMLDADLLRARPTPAVLHARTTLQRLSPPERAAAVRALAAARQQPVAAVAVAALARAQAAPVASDLGRLLVGEGAAALQPVRPELMQLWSSTNADRAQAAAAALLVLVGDGSTWFAAADTKERRCAALLALPTIADPVLRSTCEGAVAAVLADTAAPADLRAAALRALPALPTETPERTFAVLAQALAAGEARAAAAAGLLQLPRASWQPEAAGAAATAVLAWAQTVPAGERRSTEYLAATQCAEELAGTQPAARAAELRQGLRQLSVSTFVLHAVREQMRYDRARLVVAAGKPFTLELHNDDFMEHNLVVVRPGRALPLAAAAAGMSPGELDGKGRAYLPKGDDVLAATALVGPGHQASITVAAIAEPGHYEYVCTVPGHAMRMRGTLVVTKDVDAYWQQNPGLDETAPAGGEHPHGK